jgi:predicted RNase H-like HicB family nuclease
VKRARRKKTEGTVYTVIVTREKDGRYVVCAPALNFCGGYGDTLPEALQHAEEAIGLYLQAHRELAWPVPSDDPTICVDMTDQQEVTVYRLTIREPSTHA